MLSHFQRPPADSPVGAISNFFSLLIKSFGYTSQQSLLYGTPGGAVEVVALIANGFLGDYTKNRILISIIGMVVCLVGMIMIIAVPAEHPSGRLAGYVSVAFPRPTKTGAHKNRQYMTQASPTGFVCILSLISTNVAGYTKKTTIAAMYLIGYCVGNIIGPQTFRGTSYVPAEITICVCWGVCIGILLFIYAYCRWSNAKKASVRSAPGYEKLENQE